MKTQRINNMFQSLSKNSTRTSERFLANIFLTNTDIAETKVSLESL